MRLVRHYLDIVPDRQISLSMLPDMQKLNTVFQYIEEHINDNVSVEQLAGLIHYNPNYFIRFFKSKMKMTPVQYIIKVRIEKQRAIDDHGFNTGGDREKGRDGGSLFMPGIQAIHNMSPGNSVARSCRTAKNP